ncbi:MAG: OsmC family protein [Pseudomonadota bacterium]
MPEATIINGVDRDALFATIEAVKADPAIASFEFRLNNEWKDGGLNRSVIADFYGTGETIAHDEPFEIYNDEPHVLLSGDKAPNPVEYLLHALAGCVTTSLAYHAAANDIPVEAVRTRFEGDLDLRGFLGTSKDVRKGFSAIRVVFDIEGDLTLEQKRELMAYGPRFSPVFDVVSNGTPVTCELAEDREAKAVA